MISIIKTFGALVFLLCVAFLFACLHKNQTNEIIEKIRTQKMDQQLLGDGERTDWENKFQLALP
tara:strand:- start:27 stop:218 length:192 start_codon:yes stop_codon:yes gene_type:complete